MLPFSCRATAAGSGREAAPKQQPSPLVTVGAAAVGLALVSYDVFGPGSAHLLQPLDTAAHAWVVANLDATTQTFWAGKAK